MGNDRITNLYHCTKEESLIKILESKHFLYSYCLENFSSNKLYSFEKRAYAMVCFADLFDNELSGHIKQFQSNSYLKMDKKWAEDKQISPVLYYNSGSLSSWAFISINRRKNELSVFQNEEEINEIYGNLAKSIELFRPFLKQYKGKYFIKGTDEESDDEVEFFLEREWRSVPVVEGFEHMYLDINDYKDLHKRSMYQKELFEHGYCLEFGWNDILKIGCCKEKKDAVIFTIQKAFGVDNKTAGEKMEIIGY